MNTSIVVFDFDKTLTNKDTLFGFYKTVAGNDHGFFAKRIILIAAGVLYKVRLLKNDTLKSIGIKLFVKGKTRCELESAAKKYAKQIEFNDIYFNHYQKADGEKWIISASPEIYLNLLFPGENVAGTTFNFTEEKAEGLNVNMFGQEKKRFLNGKGVSIIDEFYTDSQSDKPLMDISKKVYIVEKGEFKVSNK